ncbi:unnamed protein product [Caenorhabditis bovis]|uniref:Uncharacterized protein n=1 Tax=Caenorhabditis bovis TaxID=2654633 RepID=A0A8S1EN90_9PELO|nr:unnamed protein product [Caenorhabditis bovis]
MDQMAAAMKEVFDDYFKDMYVEFEENRSIKDVMRQEILESAGLMYPSNYDDDDDPDNSEEEARHNAELARWKKEKELELIEEEIQKSGTIKSIIMMIESDGWFEEEEPEDDGNDD